MAVEADFEDYFGDSRADNEMDLDDIFGDSRVEDIQRIVYYDYARGADMFTESSDLGERSEPKPSNGWQMESAPALHETYEGRVPLNLDSIVSGMDCPNESAFVIEERRDLIFYDGPAFLKPYFRYTFCAKPYTKGMGWRNRRIAYCDKNSFRWEPLALSTKIARHIILHEFGSEKYEKVKSLALASLPRLVQREADRKRQNPAYVEKLTFEDIQSLVSSAPNLAAKIRQHPTIKMVFLHSKLAPMYAFYPVSTLLHLEIDSIHALAEYFRSDSLRYNPADLCFWHTNRQFKARKDENQWYLPELTQKQYHKLCKMRKFVQKPQTELAVELYDTVRDHCRSGGHKYIRRRDLYVLAGSPDTKHFNCAIDDLLVYVYKAFCVYANPHAAKTTTVRSLAQNVTDDLVYLREVFVGEEMIVESLEKVCENHATLGVPYKPESKWELYDFLPSYSMCSEQMRMLDWCSNLWMVNISGPGGSGKTDSLCRYLARVPSNVLLFVTHQANNMATARERVTRRAYTAHKLLFTHCRVCNKSPCREGYMPKNQKAGANAAPSPEQEGDDMSDGENVEGDNMAIGIRFDKCIFENIRVLVIDEISLFYDHLFAGLVYALVTCGQLCQVIICGDFRQQPQIQIGQLQKDLAHAFDEYTLSFEHCHRFAEGSASILWNNATAIHENRPEDVYHDGECSLRIPFPKGLQFQDQEMIAFMKKVFKKYGIDDDEGTIVVARTRKLRDMANKVIQEICHHSDSPGLVIGQKIMYLSTNYKLNLTAKEILVLERIEDCEIPPRRTVRSLKDKDYKKLRVLRNDACDTYRNRKPRNMARRLICRSAGKEPSESSMRIIPFNDRNRSLIRKASAITERGIQGSEMHIVCVLKPFFWAVADVKESCYVVSSRPKQQILWVCEEHVLRQWIMNPSPKRDSIMGIKLRKLYEKNCALYPPVLDSAKVRALQLQENNCYAPKFDREEFEKKRKRVTGKDVQNKKPKI
jgi:hypothetical protein